LNVGRKIMKKHEYFSRKYIKLINNFIKKHPDDVRKNIGVICEGRAELVASLAWGEKPKCTVCGQEMYEDTINDPDSKIGWPRWFCANSKCQDYQAVIRRWRLEEQNYEGKITESTGIPELCEKMGIPSGLHSMTLENLTFDHTSKVKTRVVANECLIINGKDRTHLAIGLLLKYGKNRPYKCWFQSVPQLYSLIQQKIANDEDYAIITNRIVDYDLLVLEDIGSIKLTEHRRDILYQIISSRYFEHRQTIITTPFSKDKIDNDFGDVFGEKIKEYATIEMGG